LGCEVPSEVLLSGQHVVDDDTSRKQKDDVDSPGSGESLDQFRSYLRLLANLQLDKRIKSKIDASDIVQQTMLQAYKAKDQFRGENDKQRAAWLRQILARNLMHASRDMTRDKRDVRREQAMQAAVNQSSLRLEQMLSGDESTPSIKAQRGEELFKMAESIEQLPDPQREALMLHYLEQHSLSEVAERLGKTRGAVAGLVRRALATMREAMESAADGKRDQGEQA